MDQGGVADARRSEVARKPPGADEPTVEQVRARYGPLLDSIQTTRDVAVEVEATGPNAWTVAVSTGDRRGALASIVGLLTAERLDILQADVWTLDSPAPARSQPARRRPIRRAALARPPLARRVLDVFRVAALAEPPPDLWPRFRADLAALLDAPRPDEARDEVIDRVSEAFRALGNRDARLLPIAVEVSTPPDAALTRLSVRSADTPGFLFAFANALSDLGIEIARARIRTVAGEARDTFWVADARGQPIRDAKRVHELRAATSLIKQFTYLLPRSPNPGQALRQFDALISQILTRPEWTSELADLDSPAVLEALADLMGVSRFLWEDFLRLQHANLFPLLIDPPALARGASPEALRDELARRLAAAATPAEGVDLLNAFKDREMFRIDLRHVVGRSDFAEFSRELTGLAEIAVESAVALAAEELRPRYGTPRLTDGRVCPLCACALGKFGGAELGFGSDLELIFVYAAEGTTDGPVHLQNSEYFGRLVQAFLHTLSARQEGIFEIDLRLRPFGKAGALASSLDGFAAYYSDRGAAEQFERLALVRLRPVAGDPALGEQVRRARDAFVYSGRPLDLGNVLHLRHRQATELVRRGQVNAKYSAGGLVDVEYFVQVWQISVGAADPAARVANTREAIHRLTGRGYLPERLASELTDTYEFLRRLIDALRVVRGNAKDLTIPPESSREFAYLAQRLRFASSSALGEAIAARMSFARGLWVEAAPPPSPGESAKIDEPGRPFVEPTQRNQDG